tara:strand:- start:8074 stop:8331 length:258 start_codon:yes stop_codon:yes gene_type:complete
MPRGSLRNLLRDHEAVEFSQRKADKNGRSLRHVKDDIMRDSAVYEDRKTGERRSIPNKFIKAIGTAASFELIDPDLDVVKSLELN